MTFRNLVVSKGGTRDALQHVEGLQLKGGVSCRTLPQSIRFWGMTPSYAFVGEPQTNGVIERFFRTLKEQIVHGRIYQTIEEFRDAVRDFIGRYNAEWLIEKNGLRSPSETRAAWYQPVMRAAA